MIRFVLFDCAWPLFVLVLIELVIVEMRLVGY